MIELGNPRNLSKMPLTPSPIFTPTIQIDHLPKICHLINELPLLSHPSLHDKSPLLSYPLLCYKQPSSHLLSLPQLLQARLSCVTPLILFSCSISVSFFFLCFWNVGFHGAQSLEGGVLS